MINVLIVNFTHSKAKEVTDQLYPHIPTDLLYHAASLNDYKYNFAVWNEQLSNYKDLEKKMKAIQPLHYVFVKHLPHNVDEVLAFVKRIKNDETYAKTSVITIGKQSDVEIKNYIEAGVEFCLFDEQSASAGLFISQLNVPFNPFLDDISGLAFKNYFGDVRKNELLPHPFKMKAVGEVLKHFNLKEYTNKWQYSYKKHGFPFLQLHLPHHSLAYSLQLFEKALFKEGISKIYIESTESNLPEIVSELQEFKGSIALDIYTNYDSLSKIEIKDYHWNAISNIWINVSVSTSVRWFKITQLKRQLREKGVGNVGLCFTEIDRFSSLKNAVSEFRKSELKYFFDDKHLPKWKKIDKARVSLLFKYPFLTKSR